jgi:hypothetical protein
MLNVAKIRKLPARRLRPRTWTIPLLDAEPLPHPWGLPLSTFLRTLQAVIWFSETSSCQSILRKKIRIVQPRQPKNWYGERHHKLYSTSLWMIWNVKIQGIGILNACRMSLYYWWFRDCSPCLLRCQGEWDDSGERVILGYGNGSSLDGRSLFVFGITASVVINFRLEALNKLVALLVSL